MLKKAGMEGQEVVFLFSDTQILHEGFLEDLNNILNAGEGVWVQHHHAGVLSEVQQAAYFPTCASNARECPSVVGV